MLRPAAGLQPTDVVAGWSSDGSAVFVARVPQVPAMLERVNAGVIDHPCACRWQL